MAILTRRQIMNKVLVLNAGLNGENSNSNKLTQAFINQLASESEVFTRDLNNEALPHLTAQEMGAWMTPADELTPEQRELASISDKLIQELLDHDTIVIGMPMYNMGVPSTFKTYIDRIARAGKTFSYTESGPVGLVKDKKVVVLAARGGMYQGTPLDSQTSYLKSIFGLMGVVDIEFVYAEGLNMGEQVANQAWQQAELQIAELV